MTLEQTQSLRAQLNRLVADIEEMKRYGTKIPVKLKMPTIGKIKIGNLMHGAIASIKPSKKRKTMDTFKARMESVSALIEEADNLGEDATPEEAPEQQLEQLPEEE